MNRLLLAAALLALAAMRTQAQAPSPAAPAAGDGALQIEGDKPMLSRSFSYILGIQTGNHLRKQLPRGVDDIDLAAMAQGIREALRGQPPRMDVAEMTFWSGKFMEMLAERERQRTAQNLVEGAAFRERYGARDGVSRTSSGVLYRELVTGTGRQPGIGQSVRVHYRGTLVDGIEFDSSYARGEPQTLAVREVIPGWQEILTLMPVGSKWEAVIPPELAYGESGAGKVGPNQTLVFEIELIGIE